MPFGGKIYETCFYLSEDKHFQQLCSDSITTTCTCLFVPKNNNCLAGWSTLLTDNVFTNRTTKNQTNRLKHPYKFSSNVYYLGAVKVMLLATVFKNV